MAHGTKVGLTRRLKRVHSPGTEVEISPHTDGWRIQIDLREANHNPATITGYMAPTLERAKEVADQEISKYGHVCNEACKDWVEVPEVPHPRQS